MGGLERFEGFVPKHLVHARTVAERHVAQRVRDEVLRCPDGLFKEKHPLGVALRGALRGPRQLQCVASLDEVAECELQLGPGNLVGAGLAEALRRPLRALQIVDVEAGGHLLGRPGQGTANPHGPQGRHWRTSSS